MRNFLRSWWPRAMSRRGQVLDQSEDGSLVQYVQPGIYEVSVSSRSAGRYQLIVESVPATGQNHWRRVG
jgi:hypothetical protein